MPLKFIYTTCRPDFFRTLAEVREETARRIVEKPGWVVLEIFVRELNFMQNATADGRKPTFGERQSITMGRVAVDASQGSSGDWEDYFGKIMELDYYFKLWRSDKGLARASENDHRYGFPDDQDLSDEPG
jgi:hypothetical protein